LSENKKPLIDPDMTVLDIVSAYKQTIDVFKTFDEQAGECICCRSLFISLDSVAAKYHIDLSLLLSALEKAAQSREPDSASK